MARHKGKVEGGVKYVQNNALKGRLFPGMNEQNRYLLDWEHRVADHRIHGTTKKQVRALFEARERPALLPLPEKRFPFFHESQRRVHRDGHVAVAKAFYSVPPEYLGRDVWVRYNERLLQVFNHRFEQIAMHLRVADGRFSTLPQHIHPAKTSAVEKGSPYLLGRARLLGPSSGAWALAVIDARGVEGMRSVVGFLALSRKHDAGAIEEAAGLALTLGAFRLKAIRKLLERPRRQYPLAFLEDHPLIRSLGDYEAHLAAIGPSPWAPNPG